MIAFSFLIGLLTGVKNILLFFGSMFLDWLTDIRFVMLFGFINGFIDAHIFLRAKHKIITFAAGILTTLSIMTLLGGTDHIARVRKYISYIRFNADFDYEPFGPAGGFGIIVYFILFSLISIFTGFCVAIIIMKITKSNRWIYKKRIDKGV